MDSYEQLEKMSSAGATPAITVSGPAPTPRGNPTAADTKSPPQATASASAGAGASASASASGSTASTTTSTTTGPTTTSTTSSVVGDVKTTTTTTTASTTEEIRVNSVVSSSLLDDDIENDLKYTTDKLDDFYAQLRADIQSRLLASQARTRQHYANQLNQLRLLHTQQITTMQKQIDTLKEQLFWSEKKAANFLKPYDKMKQLYTQMKVVGSRADMQRRYFLLWRQNIRYTIPPKQLVQVWVDPMAKKNKLRSLFVNWRSISFQKRQQRDTTFWKNKLKEISGALVDRYEGSLTELRVQLADAHMTIRREKEARLDLQRSMQQAFLRGVSALNMEALSVFHDNNAGPAAHLHTVQPPAPGDGGGGGSGGGRSTLDDEKRSDVVAEDEPNPSSAGERILAMRTQITHDAPVPSVVADDSIRSNAPSPNRSRRSALPQMTQSVSIEPCNTVTQLPPTLLPESVLPSSGSIATGATLTAAVQAHRLAAVGGGTGPNVSSQWAGSHAHALPGGGDMLHAPNPTLTMMLSGPVSGTPSRHVHAASNTLSHRQSSTTNTGKAIAAVLAAADPMSGATTAAAGSAAGKFVSRSGSARKQQSALSSSIAYTVGGGPYGALGGAIVDFRSNATKAAADAAAAQAAAAKKPNSHKK